MAQTKTRKTRSSSASSRKKSPSGSRSGGDSRKSGNSNGGSAKARKSSGSSTAAKTPNRTRSGKATQSKRSSQSRQRTQSTRSDDGKSTVGTIAEKAKGPALAGGAALLGLAGGLVLTRKQKRKSVLSRLPTPKVKRPNVKLPKLSAPEMPNPATVVKAVGDAAGQVADRSNRVGRIATQVQQATNAIDRDDR